LHEALLLALAVVVGVAFDPVDADDRQQHMVAHARPLLGGEQVAGGGAEVGHRLVRIGHRRVRGVDERLDTSERLVQPVAGEEVRTQRTADAGDVVPVPLEGGGGERADVTGRSGDCEPHQKLPRVVSSWMTGRRQLNCLRAPVWCADGRSPAGEVI